jgi:hypothetical protein
MYGAEGVIVKSTVPDPRAYNSIDRFSAVYGSRARRDGAASPGVEAELPWTDMPRIPPDGAVVPMVDTEGMELDAGSCL